MNTIKEIYKIGRGPSSSHTMGPYKAARMFAQMCPEAQSYRVSLYGSLAATGKGHLTDTAVRDGLAPKDVEIVWRADVVPQFHTNCMHYEGLDAEGNAIREWTV